MADILVGRGVRRPAPTLFDLITGPATSAQSALGAMGSAAKGAAQATVGFPGDIESLVRMITGGEQKLPTTEQVGQFVNQYIRAPYPQYERLGEFTGLPVAGALNRPVTQLTNEAADELVRMITRNPQATAPSVLQETAMPFMQAVAPRTPGLLETPAKSELGFYSALEQATMPMQNKGTGAQFLAQIEKTAGVKPEEVKWTGLDEFLKSRQNVTKQEVQDYLSANRVNLQEVRLSSVPEGRAYSAFGDETEGYFVTDPMGSREVAGPFADFLDAEQEAQRLTSQMFKSGPKFSQYTLPGGENYREILLTLPEPIEAKMFRDLELRVNAGERLKPEELQKYYDLVDAQAFKNQYFGPHYEQANILAHMRVNDRVVDGKKTLFIEEIQSDWHQAGRKKGYGPQTETTHEAYYTTPDGQRVSLGFGKTQEEAAAAVDPGWQGIVDVKFDTQTKKIGEGVPDAPFKTTWHELTLKRAIQEASEKGYDQIAFTTGKTQAERYDLSKQVDYIDYVKEGPDQFRLAIVGKNGQGIDLPKETFSTAELENYVGKEVAERIVKGEGQTGGGRTTLRGPDLQIGGEGMKGFYDQILPKSLEKLGKKFDAKVGKTFIEGERTRDADGFPSMYPEKIEVWKMDITPKMRESVTTKGQPLFAATPVLPAGLLGRDEEE